MQRNTIPFYYFILLLSSERGQLPSSAFNFLETLDTRLVDIMSEIQCLREDSNYATVYSFFDTSTGVNTIIAKLPQFLQNQWVDRATRYKNSRSVTLLPFTRFIDLITEMASTLGDPCFMFDHILVTEELKQVQKQRLCYVTTEKTGVKQDGMSEYKQKVLYPTHPKSCTHALQNCKEFLSRNPPMRRKDFGSALDAAVQNI